MGNYSWLKLRRMLQESKTTNTVDQNLAVYIYIFLGGMALVGLISLLVYCYHQRRLQRYVDHDNLNNNMQRHSLIDSFIEDGEAEWQCSVCYHENHPAKTDCLMCGTAQVISLQAIATPKHASKIPNVATVDDEDSQFLQAARQRSFHVRRLNQMNLNQRQRGARRRHLWKRGKGQDGQLRWYRTEDCKPRVSVLTANPCDYGPSDIKDTMDETRLDLEQEIESHLGYETQLVMSPGPNGTQSPNITTTITRSGHRADDNGCNLVAEPSVGFVRHVDDDGNVSWVPAESVRISEHNEIDPTEFPRASTAIDFESVAALPFRQKVRWFLLELDKVSVPWEDGHLLLKIRRDAVLQESLHLLMLVPASDIRQRLRIEFIDEPGLDAGGLMREWVLLLCEQLFDESFGLFQTTHVENLSYWINPSSGQLHEDHLKCYEFIGRLVAKTLLEGQLLTIHFALPLLKHILGVPISFSDLEFLDDELYKNSIWIRENTGVESLSLDFTLQRRDAGGKLTIVELKPNGADIPVTDANKEEYLSLMLRYRMFECVSEQVTALLKGLYDVLPRTLLAVFDYQELELLLCGVPNIDVNDWKRHTDAKFQDFDHPTKGEKKVVGWFWDTVEAFSQEQRARLLQFVTGTSRVPVEGFKALMSNDGRVRRFGVQIVGRGSPPAGLYPKAHTCFNRIDLPLYQSKEELETYLTLVINMEITGFTMQ